MMCAWRSLKQSLFVAFLCSATAAQGLAEPQTGTTEVTGALSLDRLVDLASARLGTPVEYDAGQLRAQVAIRMPRGIEDADLWGFVNAILEARGRTTVRRDASRELLSVVQTSEAMQVAGIEQINTAELPSSLAGYRSIQIRLVNTTADEMVDLLQPATGRSTGSIRPVPGGSDVVVSDFAARLDQTLRLIALLDAPGRLRGMSIVTLESLSAETAIAAVGRVRPVLTASKDEVVLTPGPDRRTVIIAGTAAARTSVIALLEELDSASRRSVRLYDPQGFGATEVVELLASLLSEDSSADFVEDRLTNTIQVTATELDHDRIERVLNRLGEVPAEQRRPVRTITVRNREPSELVGVIQDLLSAGGPIGTGQLPERNDSSAGRLLPATDDPVSERAEVQLSVDPATSRIIVMAEPATFRQVEDLVRLLDVRQPQVMLEVVLVTLSEGQSRDLGVELQYLVSDAGTLVGLTSLFGLSSIDPTSAGPPLGSGSGGTAVVLDPGNYSAVIRAIENTSEGRSLSTPKVLVNNAETATIDSVVQEPFLSTNASDTVATTSFGGPSDAGTQVSVTPQIAEGDHIVLQYSISLSAFTGESADPSLPPPRQDNSITSRATIPDGYTIVVGGIEVTSEAEAVSQVPLLGWIPGLGELFKSRSSSSTKSRFYAFIRADVLRRETFEDLKYLTEVDARAADVENGWPVVDPRVIR